MYTERRIERHQLPYFLKVYNRFTDRPMGYLGDVSKVGLMLISTLPLLTGAEFELQLRVPGKDDPSLTLVNVTATCVWCREDMTPGHYDSGFILLQAPDEYLRLVDALRYYFSFHPMSASA